MSNITDYILSRTNRLKKHPEVSPGDHNFEMFNDAGTEVEVSEWLYSMVRLVKPNQILETGTHIGVSAAYMGQALKDNKRGLIRTFEIISQHFDSAKALFKDLDLEQRIFPYLKSALEFDPNLTTSSVYDMLFLDSEPQLRFNEFVKFWPNLRSGGYIIIHDLNDQLGHSGITAHGQYDWPWGDFREKIGGYIRDGKVNVISFDNPRGMTMFQKTKETAAYYKMAGND